MTNIKKLPHNKMNKNTGIYKITSPTGKVYIGQAVDIERRFKEYYKLLDKIKTQTRLYKSLLKYGFEAHQCDVIEYCSEDELNCSERFWQDEFDVIGENGLNCILQECGEKRRGLSEETKRKLSEAGKNRAGESHHMYGILGENNPNFGSKRTEEQCANISASLIGKRKGENNNMFGKTHSEETRKKIGDSNRGKKRTFSEQALENAKRLGKERRGKPNYSNRKTILCLRTGIFYFGVEEAAEARCISKSMVTEHLTRLKVNRLDLIYV